MSDGMFCRLLFIPRRFLNGSSVCFLVFLLTQNGFVLKSISGKSFIVAEDRCDWVKKVSSTWLVLPAPTLSGACGLMMAWLLTTLRSFNKIKAKCYQIYFSMQGYEALTRVDSMTLWVWLYDSRCSVPCPNKGADNILDKLSSTIHKYFVQISIEAPTDTSIPSTAVITIFHVLRLVLKKVLSD